MNRFDPIKTWEKARAILGDHGYSIGDVPPASNEWRRIPANGKGDRNTSAAVTITADGGAVHLRDHVLGFTQTVCASTGRVDRSPVLHGKRRPFTSPNNAISKRQRARENGGIASAQAIWKSCIEDDGQHPYAARKGVQLPGCRQKGSRLLIPMTDIDGQIQTLQLIAPDGNKRMAPGAPTRGAAYRIGSVEHSEIILIVEGAATGASVHAETVSPVVCAMSAGNLLRVATDLRDRFPDAEMIVLGDDDRHSLDNIGRKKTLETARAVNAKIVFPSFCRNDCACSDFNDVVACERAGCNR